MIKVVDENFSKEVWDSVAQNPLQAWEWGEARKKMGVQVVRLGEFEGQALKNVFQMTLHRLPLNHRIGYIPRSVAPTAELIDFLKNFAKENKLLFIKFEPYVKGGELTVDGLTKSSNSLFPDWTQILDLQKTEEELLRNMKSKTRYNIRLAEKKGVTVKEMTSYEGFEIFIELYFETTKRQKYFGHNLDYHKAVFESLKNNIAHLLIAFYENTPVAAYQLFMFKNRGYYTYGGSSVDHRNTMAANLLMWESIKFAKNKGARHFDMWGSLPPDYDQNHPWAGFTRFKEGYGGEFVQFAGSFDLVINKTLYPIYNSVYKLREVYLKLRA